MDYPETLSQLDDLVRRTIEELDGSEAEARSTTWWPDIWEMVVFCAFDLGRSEVVDGLDGKLPNAVFAPSSAAGKAIRDRIRERLVEVQRRLNGTDTSYSALVDDDYHPPSNWHVTPEGRVVLADGFAQTLNGIADEFEAGNLKGLREHELREQAGTVIINAYTKGFLRGIPNLGKFVAWHTASNESDPQVGDGGLQARRCRCPTNLFLDVIGGQKVIVRLEADGKVTELGPKPDDGILPAIDPAAFKRGDAVGACRFLATTLGRELRSPSPGQLVKVVNKQLFLDLIKRRGSRPVADITETAWNLRGWIREAAIDPTLSDVLAVLLPGIRRRLEVSLLDAELSRYAPNLPSGSALSAANMVAFIEAIEFPGGTYLRPPSGPPPDESLWKSLSRMRAIRIAMQLCSESGERMFDPEKDDDLDTVERIGVDKLAALWNVIEETFPFNGPVSGLPNSDNPFLDTPRDSLKPKALKALEFIEKEGPKPAKLIAKHVGVTEATLRKHFLPKLIEFGVKNDRDGSGYYIAPRHETSRDI